MKSHAYKKGLFYIILSLLAAVFTGTVLLIGAYSLPIEPIHEHVFESGAVFACEGDKYYVAPQFIYTRIDNFTDALMLKNAIFPGTGNVVQDAMMVPRAEYASSEYITQSLGLLKMLLKDDEGMWAAEYPRYWHGYLSLTKPLLSIMSYSEIRILNLCIQFSLISWLILALHKARGLILAVPFAVTVLSLNPITSAICMQYSSIFYITMISALVMVYKRTYQSETYWRVFLWIGICTAYFDFLTYPVAALGINLLLMLALCDDSMPIRVRKIIVCTIVWLIGYAGMWVAKWLVAWLLTGNNPVLDGLDAVKRRIAADTTPESGVSISLFGAIYRNVSQYFNVGTYFLLLAGCIVFACLIAKKRIRFRRPPKSSSTLMIVALYPFLWYAVVQNHSVVHPFLAHKNLSVTIFSLCLILASCFTNYTEGCDTAHEQNSSPDPLLQ